MTEQHNPAYLRKALRQQRRQLSRRQQIKHGKSVAKLLARHPWFQHAKVIAVYLDADGEVSTSAIVDQARKVNKQLLLPVLHPFRHGRLLFRNWPLNARMETNRYAIKEPSSRYAVINVRRVDLVIVPLVAFDRRCYRMGMGGGYYDRTFAFRHINSWRKPRLIGVAHSLQMVNEVDNQAWDIALDAIITEQGIMKADMQTE